MNLERVSNTRQHMTRLQAMQQQAEDDSPILNGQYIELPYEQGYWKEHATRIQTTSRPEGRRHSPHMYGLTQAKRSSAMQYQQQHLMHLATSSRSPTSILPTDAILSSRGSMTATSNGDRPLKIYMAQSQSSQAGKVNRGGAAAAMIRQRQQQLLMHQQQALASGGVQNTSQNQQILEEDSLYHTHQATHRMNVTGGPSTFRNAASDQDQITLDSIYRKSDFQPNNAEGDDRFGLKPQQKRTSSIYSIRDQIHVNNIIKRKFPHLDDQPFDAKNRQRTIMQESDHIQSATASFEMSQASHHARKHAHRSMMDRSLNVPRTNQLKMQTMSSSKQSRASVNAQSVAMNGLQGKRQYMKYASGTEESMMAGRHQNSPTNRSSQTATPLGVAQQKVPQKEKNKGIFTRGVRNSIFENDELSQSQQHYIKKSLRNKHKQSQDSGEGQSSPTSGKDFMSANKKNVAHTINRLHPQYEVWDAQQERLDAEEEENDISHTKISIQRTPNGVPKTLEDKKNALIDAMQQRVSGQSTLNAQEVLAAAGISNSRIDRAQAKAKSSDTRGQQEFKENATAVAYIIRSMKIKREEVSSKRHSKSFNPARVIRMSQKQQQNSYTMPTKDALEGIYFRDQSEKKRRFISTLAAGEKAMEGKIQLKEYDSKLAQLRSSQEDPVKEYVKNFSERQQQLKKTGMAKNEAANVFTKILTQKMTQHTEEIKKNREAEEEEKKKEHARRLGFTKLDTVENMKLDNIINEARERNVFNMCLEEESKLITMMGERFVEKIKYIDRVAQRDVEHEGKGVVNTKDPKINYFLQCKKDLDLTLPILEKVIKKTLMLQEYTLSKGHCRGLAKACQFFDQKIVNRVLFNNCGIDDLEFSHILEGLAKLKDFKSIIYKMNAISDLSLEKLRPILLKRLPFQLDEIKLIDCQMNGSHICKLMDSLLETNSQLSKLALVNANQTESSFDKVIGFLRESRYLKELDLSWSKLSPIQWRKFLGVISENRQLSSLNISHNKILEAQTQSPQEVLEGVEQELTARNRETMTSFKDFIKYNAYLISINLENTGLIAPAITYICSLLRKSQGLRCLHLCANEGISPQIIEQISLRIKAKDPIEPRVILPYKKAKQEENKVARAATKFGKALIQQREPLEEIHTEQKWMQIREGLKLRSVINSKRINDLSTYLGEIDMEGSFLSRKFIIQRHLGLKHLIPHAARWQIMTDKRDECWKCGQHILTIFLWTPRIGKISCEKDPEKEKYYKKKIHRHRDMDKSLAMNVSRTPLIAASFNEWRYERMQEVLPFCMDNDMNQPDFLELSIKDGDIRPDAKIGKLNQNEKDLIAARKTTYYIENWQTILMQMMRFKKPMVANAHELTAQSLKVDPSHPVYIHMAWCKPGLHTYCISHNPDDIASDGEEGQQEEKFNLFMNMKMVQGNKKKKKFFVHDMLATLREEEVPLYYNPRHVKKTLVEKHTERPVFDRWITDTPEIISQMFNHDKNKWNLKNVCATAHEYSRISELVVTNYSLLTDVYHYLQSKSDRYPWVSFYTARKHFFMDALVQGYGVKNTIFDLSIKAADYNRGDSSSVVHDGVLRRYQFIEWVILLSKQIFMQHDEEICRDSAVDEKYTGLDLLKQTQLFLNTTLRKFVDNKVIEWQDFREDRLWVPDVRLLYTMNEGHLRKMYSQYAAKGRGLGTKPFNCDYMELADCVQLFCKDTNVGLHKDVIKYAFVMSKMTVVEETNPDAVDTYGKLLYVEFLEVIARVAEQYFLGSEMEELDLNLKIEFLLDEMLPAVGETRVKQEAIIAEFSESDDDY